jgi:AcrR family transcriptional regulator
MESSVRPLRADAERNRRRILDAARETFAEHGLGVGVDTIARAAGVGVGTLYRRFPTKDDLLAAILEDRVESFLAELAAFDGVEDAWEAFAGVAGALASGLVRDRAFFALFQQSGEPLPGEAAKARLVEALCPFLERAQAAGAVRDDIVVDDVPAMCAVGARLPAWRLAREPELWRRYLAIVLDGLRPEGAHPLPHPPPLPLTGR